jgi:hypothetical protein
MNYAVTIRFIADPDQYACAPLASLRGDNPGEGWVVRIDDGILSACSGEGPHVNARIRWGHGEHEVSWRVFGERHELWLDGVPVTETSAELVLGEANVLRHGEDPEMPGCAYNGVVEVSIG